MNIAAVVIWYHPQKMREKSAVQNILTYSAFCRKIYIIDNSPNDNSNLSLQIPNSQYIPNFDNLGIAKALNQGCQAAMDDEGSDAWVLTMDQDSFWSNSEELHRYIEISEKLFVNNKLNISFSPGIKGLSEVAQGGIDESIQHTKIIWTSGNILYLKAWLDIGKFNEQLFIDDVDHEFCYRLRSRGYNLINIQNCYINHEIGSHHGVRMYYIVRNCLYMKKHYPEFWREYNRLSYLYRLFIEKIKHIKMMDIYFMIKGLIHAKIGIYGKYK